MGVDGRLLAQTESLTESHRGPAAVIVSVQQAIRHLAAALDRLEAIGVACAGMIEPATGSVVYAPNLDWRDVALGARLRDAFGVPVTVENDVRAAAWGEFRFGVGRGVPGLLAVFVGTGIGSGAVLHGALWRGQGNVAGEIGHTQVVPDGLPCPCGQRGCLEQYASGSGLQRRFQAALAAGASTRLGDLTGREPERLTAPMVSAAAEDGDDLARELWGDLVRFLSMGLANYVTLLNPGLLVLGGGVLESVPTLFETLAAAVVGLTTLVAGRTLRVERPRLGDWSGVVGAADLATPTS